jgi:TRAP-type C4-dicarboxylate transport system permease small subunit
MTGDKGKGPVWRNHLLRKIGYIPEFLLGFTVFVTTVAIFTQVVSRYLFNHPISWVDEFAVLIFAWMIFLGVAIAQKNNEHIGIDIIARVLPPRVQRVLAIFTNIVILLVLAFLFVQGISLTMKTAGLKYPAMEISRGFLYVSIPVMMPLMAFYLIRIIITDLRSFITEDTGGRP